jgi:uncharacterized phage protein (TIGR01671 family)
MREIKFKAKQLNSGKWFEGDLVHLGNRVCIGGDNIKDGITDVDPETVCQFTGLTDCKGKEIWEGDIVEREIWNKLYNGLTKVKGVIEYKGAEFFVAINSETYSLYSKDIKVVGNKFDKEK